ncbi:GNAT family N-acetyltransferase [Francisella sp. Scap27]|nr:GNAT family N-acetyltransferase [Francisella sp. Scap27]
MPHFDMLVKLYNLELDLKCISQQTKKNIIIRKALAPEKSIVLNWIKKEFAQAWADEADIAFSNNPGSIFIAIKDKEIIGFACYDSTMLNFFGPTGVSQSARGLGTGKALLQACMMDMKLKGYAYAIIGAVGPAEFYEKAVGAIKIDGSWPGAYANLLKS